MRQPSAWQQLNEWMNKGECWDTQLHTYVCTFRIFLLLHTAMELHSLSASVMMSVAWSQWMWPHSLCMYPNYCWTKLSCTVDFHIFCDLFPQIDPLLLHCIYTLYTCIKKDVVINKRSNEPLRYHEKVHSQGTNVNKAGLRTFKVRLVMLTVDDSFWDNQAWQWMTSHFKLSLQCNVSPIMGFVRHIACNVDP